MASLVCRVFLDPLVPLEILELLDLQAQVVLRDPLDQPDLLAKMELMDSPAPLDLLDLVDALENLVLLVLLVTPDLLVLPVHLALASTCLHLLAWVRLRRAPILSGT